MNTHTHFKHPTGGRCAHCKIDIPRDSMAWADKYHVFCSVQCMEEYGDWGKFI